MPPVWPFSRQEKQEGCVSNKSNVPGFMLLDTSFRPVAYNAEAVEILAFPNASKIFPSFSEIAYGLLC